MNKPRGIIAGLIAMAWGLGLCLTGMAGEGKEEKVALKDCPDAVLKTFRQEAGNGQILEIEKEVHKGGAVVYEAEIKLPDGKRIEVEVAASGKLIGVEVEEDERGEKDDGEGKGDNE